MKRIDSYGSVAPGLFTEGNPIGGVPATRVAADWLNTIQEEVATVVEAAGISLDQTGSNTSQLLQALQQLFGGGVPIGSIQAYAGSTIPDGWLLCDGRYLYSLDNPELFDAIGYSWGGGEGTFYIPDLRGRFLRGVSALSGNDPDAASRTAQQTGGNTGNAVGSLQGDELKAHTHNLNIPLGDNNNDNANPPAASDGNLQGVTYTAASGSSGGTETRPKNANVNFIIKAGNYVLPT